MKTKFTLQGVTPIYSEQAREYLNFIIAYHEAGHFVMHWYCGNTSAVAKVNDDYGGICSWTPDCNDKNIFFGADAYIAIGGYSAEYLDNIQGFLKELKCHKFAWRKNGHSDYNGLNHDFDTMWHWFKKIGISGNKIIRNMIITHFIETVNILNQYRQFLDEAAELLLLKNEITKDEATKLFLKWGEPKRIFCDYNEVQKYLNPININNQTKKDNKNL